MHESLVIINNHMKQRGQENEDDVSFSYLEGGVILLSLSVDGLFTCKRKCMNRKGYL